MNDSSKENVVLMLDFPEIGAPDAWVKAHTVKKATACSMHCPSLRNKKAFSFGLKSA